MNSIGMEINNWTKRRNRNSRDHRPPGTLSFRKWPPVLKTSSYIKNSRWNKVMSGWGVSSNLEMSSIYLNSITISVFVVYGASTYQSRNLFWILIGRNPSISDKCRILWVVHYLSFRRKMESHLNWTPRESRLRTTTGSDALLCPLYIELKRSSVP